MVFWFREWHQLGGIVDRRRKGVCVMIWYLISAKKGFKKKIHIFVSG